MPMRASRLTGGIHQRAFKIRRGHRISLLNNLYTEAGFSIVPSARLNSNDVGPAGGNAAFSE